MSSTWASGGDCVFATRLTAAVCGDTLIADGSEAARHKLTEGNLRLVVKIAHDYKNLGVPLADLIAEGNVGLMKAVTKFKPDKGAISVQAMPFKPAFRQ